jgi:hypothetical protein
MNTVAQNATRKPRPRTIAATMKAPAITALPACSVLDAAAIPSRAPPGSSAATQTPKTRSAITKVDQSNGASRRTAAENAVPTSGVIRP